MLHFSSNKRATRPARVRLRAFASLTAIMLSFFVLSSLIVACGATTTAQSTPTPTAIATPAPSPTPTFTPTPTATPTPRPTPTPSPTPLPQAAPAILDLQPASMSLVGHLDCKRTSVYVCLARVLSRSSNQSNLHWFAFTNVPGHITFSPAAGVLAPGQSIFVTISVPFNACTHGLFFFRGPINTHTITWAC